MKFLLPTVLKRLIVLALLVLAIGSVWLFYPTQSAEDLSLLEKDAMASYVPQGGRLTDEDKQGRDGPFALKPSRAQITRRFANGHGGADAEVSTATEFAEKRGWDITRVDRPCILAQRVATSTGRLAHLSICTTSPSQFSIHLKL